MYPPVLTPVASTNSHYVVVGQLRAKDTEVTVNYGFGMNDVRVTKKYKLAGSVSNTGMTSLTYLPSRWLTRDRTHLHFVGSIQVALTAILAAKEQRRNLGVRQKVQFCDFRD